MPLLYTKITIPSAQRLLILDYKRKHPIEHTNYEPHLEQ